MNEKDFPTKQPSRVDRSRSSDIKMTKATRKLAELKRDNWVVIDKAHLVAGFEDPEEWFRHFHRKASQGQLTARALEVETEIYAKTAVLSLDDFAWERRRAGHEVGNADWDEFNDLATSALDFLTDQEMDQVLASDAPDIRTSELYAVRKGRHVLVAKNPCIDDAASKREVELPTEFWLDEVSVPLGGQAIRFDCKIGWESEPFDPSEKWSFRKRKQRPSSEQRWIVTSYNSISIKREDIDRLWGKRGGGRRTKMTEADREVIKRNLGKPGAKICEAVLARRTDAGEEEIASSTVYEWIKNFANNSGN